MQPQDSPHDAEQDWPEGGEEAQVDDRQAGTRGVTEDQ